MYYTDWMQLPQQIRRGLLTGSTGKLHLADLARRCLIQAKNDPTLAQLGGGLLYAAWCEDPFDGPMAEAVRAVFGTGLPKSQQAVLQWVTASWKPLPEADRLQQRKDLRSLLRLFVEEGDNANPYVLQKLKDSALIDDDAVMLRKFVDRAWNNPGEPLRKGLAADLHFLSGDMLGARKRYELARKEMDLPLWKTRYGECLLAEGEGEQALALWDEVLAVQPWNVSLLLRKADVYQGIPQQTSVLNGETSLLIYSWNKAKDLERTLSGLEQAGIDDVFPIILNNGSTDNTDTVLQKFSDRWGGGRLLTVTLPCNIGAPAARNWLMQLDAVRNRPWACYLDDDATVPKGWLAKLGAAVQRYPEAGVWGCKVVDAERSWIVQNADLHIHEEHGGLEEGEQLPAGGAGRHSAGQAQIPMSSMQHQGYDFKQFNTMRNCVSVTGCCHLFRTPELLETGQFDIRYSPSQFDDLDHDLRMGLAGKTAVCQGHLTVQHWKRSGTATARGGAAAGNALGNQTKLLNTYSDKDWEKLRKLGEEASLKDVQAAQEVF